MLKHTSDNFPLNVATMGEKVSYTMLKSLQDLVNNALPFITVVSESSAKASLYQNIAFVS